MKILTMPQYSPEWWSARRGIPTSSEAKRIITPATGKPAEGADTYAAELIAASLGWYSSFKGNDDTERGTMLEPEARRWLKLQTGHTSHQVGFCLSDCGRYGASPDGLLDDGTPVEIKAPALNTFVKWAIAKELPKDHKAQCHMHMYVTGADRCMFMAYTDHPAIDNLMIEVRRDDFTAKLGDYLLAFCDRLDQLRRELTGDEYDVLFPANVQAKP